MNDPICIVYNLCGKPLFYGFIPDTGVWFAEYVGANAKGISDFITRHFEQGENELVIANMEQIPLFLIKVNG